MGECVLDDPRDFGFPCSADAVQKNIGMIREVLEIKEDEKGIGTN